MPVSHCLSICRRIPFALGVLVAAGGPANLRAAEAVSPTLENVHQLSARITSGSSPATDQDFSELAARGIRTVVSVDGARPLVELAKAHGLRYVHIPIGYDGLSREAQLMLVRVVREAEGPLYIHCHHGKHRGPAAAAIACLAEDSTDPAGAREILKLAGTSEKYRGLWRDVAKFESPAEDAGLPELVEVAEVSGLVQAMGQVDLAAEHLQKFAGAEWRTLPEHPDLTPAGEALLLSEGFREAVRFTTGKVSEPDLHNAMTAAASEAEKLHKAAQRREYSAMATCLGRLQQSCAVCHEKHRDNL